MIPPKLLTVPTDGSELTFNRIFQVEISRSKTKIYYEDRYEYKFTKSETKLGMLMTLSETQLEKSIKSKIFTCENN